MTLGQFIYLIFCACTGIIGYTIHGSIFWSIIDALFTPIAWIKWLIYKEVTLKIIIEAFDWFFKT